MLKKFFVTASIVFGCAGLAWAQNTNSSGVRPDTSAPSSRSRSVAAQPSPKPVTKAPQTQSSPTQSASSTKAAAGGQASPSGTVLAAFNNLLDGIRHADPKAATNAYQNSPRLVLFNYNGTVTKGWDQLKENREASYPNMKDVKLDVRDLRVTMLGRDAALITCQWTQSMTYKGTPETDTGRMTIVFRRIGKDWKAIHLHTSNDNPDPSRIPASEQTPPPE
jgi:ketosteroid isomerase-like protein